MLATEYQTFIHLSRYARWLDHKGRRETWFETVTRYFDFMQAHLSDAFSFDLTPIRPRLEAAVIGQCAMPSMRAMMTAGPALARDHIAGYNCAYRAIDSLRALDEVLYVLLNGTGVGFSVERQFVTQLPPVPPVLEPSSQ